MHRRNFLKVLLGAGAALIAPLPAIAPPKLSDAAALNAAIFEQLASPATAKHAADAINDFVRMRLKEQCFYRRVLPPVPIGGDENELAQRVYALRIPGAHLPLSRYIEGERFTVRFPGKPREAA